MKATRPIRAGMISPHLGIGGADFWMETTIGHCDPARVVWPATALVYGDRFDPGAVEQAERVGPVWRHPGAVSDLAAAVDVLVVWGTDPFEPGAADLQGKPVILVSHGIGPWTADAMKRASRAAALVAVSDGAVVPFPADQRGRVRVIPNGIDPARVVPDPDGRVRLRAEWGVGAEQHLALYLGRVAGEKNPRAFLAGAAACEARWPGRCAFVLVGQGIIEKEERAWAAEHAPMVRWAGVRTDVGNCLAAADTLVMASHEEACSLSLLESWTAGVPVLSTPVGLLAEPRFSGLARLLPSRPTGADVAKALELDLADPLGRIDRARRAKALAAEFTAGRMTNEYMGLIERVASVRMPGESEPPRCPPWSRTPRNQCRDCGLGIAVRVGKHPRARSRHPLPRRRTPRSLVT